MAFYFTDYVPGGQVIRIFDKLKWIGIDINSIQKITVYGEARYEPCGNGQVPIARVRQRDGLGETWH